MDPFADTSSEDQPDVPPLARSASVREPAKAVNQAAPSPVGGLSHQQGRLASDEDSESVTRKRNNRHTIQPEYVEPQSHTTRGEALTAAAAAVSAPGSRNGGQGHAGASGQLSTRSKPLPQEPLVSGEVTKIADYPTTSSSTVAQRMLPPSRPGRDVPRSVSDSAGAFNITPSQPQVTQSQVTRPSTGNASTTSARGDIRLPSRGSYGQPVAPTVEVANAHGRVTQPKSGKTYNISAPISQDGPSQSINRVPVPNRNNDTAEQAPPEPVKHHRRSSTLTGLGERLFGRSGSLLGSKQQGDEKRGKKDRKYPPTSMKAQYPADNPPRASIESKRSFSLGIGKKKSVDLESQQQPEEKPRRFSSLLPSTFSFRGLTGGGKEQDTEPDSPVPQAGDFPQPPSTGRPSTSQTSRPSGQYSIDQNRQPLGQDGQYDQSRPARTNFSRPPQHQLAPSRILNDVYGGTGFYDGSNGPQQQQSLSSPHSAGQPQYGSSTNQTPPLYPEGFNSQDNSSRPSLQQNRQGRGVLQKNNRNFKNAYDYEQGPSKHEGSSGPARKVMDYFRRRKARADSYQ